MLRALACSVRARTVLEIGAGPGASGTAFCAALRDCAEPETHPLLVSVDIDAQFPPLAVRYRAEDEFCVAWQVFTEDSRRVALELLPSVVDLLYIDGGHGVEAWQDFERFAPLVRECGLVVFDDYPLADGVRDAVHRAQDGGCWQGLRLVYNWADGNSHYVLRRVGE